MGSHHPATVDRRTAERLTDYSPGATLTLTLTPTLTLSPGHGQTQSIVESAAYEPRFLEALPASGL